MSKERNPKEFFDNRVLQLNNNAPIFGKMVRKRVIEEICATKFVGWYSEKISAVMAGLNNSDKTVSKIAEDHLLELDPVNDSQFIAAICDYYIENRDPKLLRIIRKKGYTTEFDEYFKKIEFDCGVFGVDQVKDIINDLPLDKTFFVYINTDIPDLTKFIKNLLKCKINKKNIEEVFNIFINDYHAYFCEFIEEHFACLSFEQKVVYIESIPKLRKFEGGKEVYLKNIIQKLDQEIKKDPSSCNAMFLLQKYNENIFNDWMLELLVRNRPILTMKNELALCNHFKEYDKVRDYLMKFTLEELCQYYPFFVNTPIECMFTQKLRMVIKRQNYNFDFNLVKDFMEVIEENLKIEIFKMLSNFSTPQFYDVVLYQLNKITNYSEEERRIFLEEIIPFYVPMYSRLAKEQQVNAIENLPDLDLPALTFFVNSILRMKNKQNIVIYLENLLKSTKFKDHQKFVIIETAINQMPDLPEISKIFAAVKPKYESKLDELLLLLEQLDYECSRQYIRDDKTGHNKEIDRQREKLIQEIQKIDLEKAIEILLPHFNEKNYRLKRDVKKILLGTKVGYKILIPYAFTSGLDNKDLRDFAVELLNQRIQPYLPYKPVIKMRAEYLRYVELFLSEKDLTFRNLAKSIKSCNIVIEKPPLIEQRAQQTHPRGF